MKIKHIFLGLIVSAYSPLYTFNGARQVGGISITPANIGELTQSYEELADFKASLVPVITSWLKRKAPSSHAVTLFNRDLVGDLMRSPDFRSFGANSAGSPEELVQRVKNAIEDKKNQNARTFLSLKRVNLADSNYVFKLPKDCLSDAASSALIKITGPNSRGVNLLVGAGINVYGIKPMGDREVCLTNFDNHPTYQTVSHVQISLMLQDVITKEKMQYIAAPKAFLYQLADQAKDKEFNDENSFVVQEFVPCLKHLNDHPELVNNPDLITIQMIKELKLAIEHAGLWNLKYNLAICMDEKSPYYKKLVLFDNEQRNLTSPSEFTFVSPKIYQAITNVGLREVCELLASRPDLVAILNPEFN